MSGFRLNSKGVFLTYPQCPAPREAVRDMIQSKGLNVEKGLVAQEAHASGDKHLHAYFKFDKPVNYKDPRCFDIEYEGTKYHGKYEPAKSAIASIKYISKSDQEPLEIGTMDYKQEIEAKRDKKAVLGKRLADGEALHEVLDDGNHSLIFDFKKIEANVQAYLQAKARAKPDCQDWLPNTWDLALLLEDR